MVLDVAMSAPAYEANALASEQRAQVVEGGIGYRNAHAA
jgi:hypothetical protein